jgi:hypothetical protein
MRCPPKKWRLQGMPLLIMWSGALPVDAQTLDVCNKGTVTVEVVVAERKDTLSVPGTGYWVITGTTVAPRTCQRVYDEGRGQFAGLKYPAYIGFGFADSHGQWGAGTIDRAPDMGASTTLWGLTGPRILSQSEKPLCVRQDKTDYRTQDPLRQFNCATLTIPNSIGQGPYVPLTTVLYFQPEAPHWAGDPFTNGLAGSTT